MAVVVVIVTRLNNNKKVTDKNHDHQCLIIQAIGWRGHQPKTSKTFLFV
jgi:hypothetical protein